METIDTKRQQTVAKCARNELPHCVYRIGLKNDIVYNQRKESYNMINVIFLNPHLD